MTLRSSHAFVLVLLFELACLVVFVLVASPGCKLPDRGERGRPARVIEDATGAAVAIASTERIVSVGGAVTETVYALGHGGRVVGIDTSSVFPPETAELATVGYQRQVSAEGVLSLSPTLVLLSEEAGPATAIDQLRSAGLAVFVLPARPTLDAARERLRMLGAVLDSKQRADEIRARIDTDIAAIRQVIAGVAHRPRVLFIYARGAGILSVGGRDTAAATMIELAGGQNALTSFARYRPLSAEGAVAAAPEVILLPSRGLETVGGVDALLEQPGIRQTPAGQARRIVAMDDLKLLGFGPRTGEAVRELATELHPATAHALPRNGAAP